jgi:hypothetical protein
MREIVSEFNDTVKGTCAVCMDALCGENGDCEANNFSDRVDLVRVDKCFHRFHLVCVHRYWFMPRHTITDEFGGIMEFNLPEEKSCPICRRVVDQKEVQHI